MSKLSQLEIDGIKLLLEEIKLSDETTSEMIAALGRAVVEIEEHRKASVPIARAALSWMGSKGGVLQGADIGLALAIRKAKGEA